MTDIIQTIALHDEVMSANRQPTMTQWFHETLDEMIGYGLYNYNLPELKSHIIKELTAYRIDHNITSVVIGISGGIDSAVTASLFLDAGWKVHGVLMPIRQKEEETERGIEVCEHFGISYAIRDLTEETDYLVGRMEENWHVGLHSSPLRQGNIRARMRMLTLYDFAAQFSGLVASTDNFSELAAGFWTLHGDVGDLAPIQSLSKSWEVPMLAHECGVPTSVIDAIPTDGLGISTSDEAQFGFSYLEFDLALFKLMRGGVDIDQVCPDTKSIIEAVADRVRQTVHKRRNPINLNHPWDTYRYSGLDNLDEYLIKGK